MSSSMWWVNKMYSLSALFKRNIKNYLRDKTAVFFSFLSVIILLGLYMLFLAENMKPSGLSGLLSDKELTFLVYSQLIPGLIVINTVSIPLGNLGNIINDFEYRQIDGFLVTPIKRPIIVLAYYLSSFVITTIISVLMVVGAFSIITLTTGISYPLVSWITTISYTILFSFISTAIMVFLTSLIKSVNAFGAISGVFGTIIGFSSGIYMPLFILPKGIQLFSSVMPFTHMTILLRNAMLPKSFDILTTKLAGNLTEEEIVNLTIELKEAYGMNEVGLLGMDIPIGLIMVFVVVFALGLLLLATHILNKRIKK